MVRLISYLTQALAWLAGFAMLLMMFHVMADVIGKYLFHAPVPSTAEVVANYYMIAGVFLTLAWVEATNSAIAVDLFFEMASKKVQHVMRVFAHLVTLAFYLGLGWFSWDIAVRAWQISETVDGIWRVVVWPAKFMLPIGLALAVLVLLLKIFSGDRVRIVGSSAAAEQI